MLKQQNHKKIRNIVFALGVLTQIVFFIIFYCKGGVHCDEAMTILNARSIADTGRDVLGEKMPMYFDTWLYGGQSPFATYIMALFIKIFSYSLVVSRLPIFLFYLASSFVMYLFAKEVFCDKRAPLIAFSLIAFSPWHLLQSAWTLDCAFLPCLILFGLYFIVKAINGKTPALSYCISMFFFSMCFYSYIASVLIVPVLILLIFVIGLAKKTIKFRYAILSFFVLTLFSLAFILFGLVCTGVIKPFTFLGFSFSNMPYYARSDNTVFSSGNVNDIISNGFSNVFFALTVVFFPISVSFSFAINNTFNFDFVSFGATYTIGGITALLSAIILLSKFFHKKLVGFFKQSGYIISAFAISALFYCFCVSNSFIKSIYRYSVIYLLVFILITYFVVNISNKRLKKIVKWALPVLLCLSVILSGIKLIAFYPMDNSLYINNFETSLEYAEALSTDKTSAIVLVNPSKTEKAKKAGAKTDSFGTFSERQAVYIRFLHYNDIGNFIPLKEDLLARGNAADESTTTAFDLRKDGFFRYENIENLNLEDNKIYIIKKSDLKKLDKNPFSKSTFGQYCVLYKP